MAASLIATIARKNRGTAVPLDLDSLAKSLGCARDSLRKVTMKLRTRPWFFQGYHTFLFIRYVDRGKNHVPQLHAIERHSGHMVHGRIRWHLRRKSVEDWEEYLHGLKNLSFAMIFKVRGADGTYKGCSPNGIRKNTETTANRRPYRGFEKIASELNASFAIESPAYSINLRGWASMRFAEGHPFSRVIASLRHARARFEDRAHLGYQNAAGWICGVAAIHLDLDGLTPFIRWRERGRLRKRHGACAPTFKEKNLRPRQLVEWDRKRETLRERKTLPDGSVYEYDPPTGTYKRII